MPNSKFYITAAIPYVNAKPHLGHVLEWFQADTIARWKRSRDFDVAFTCGSDENSLKNLRAAENEGKNIQVWLDEYAGIFRQAFDDFNISITHFGRGSDQKNHWPGVQSLWNQCVNDDSVYQKEYEGLYCVGCEQFYSQEELIDGLCPEHKQPPEIVKETNYFFALSKYQNQLEKIIEEDKVLILDKKFKAEMLQFIKNGLLDFSISRSKERAGGIGVPVPNDDSQIMYVWFDALSIYLTALGWPNTQSDWGKYWPADVHCIGKGITRFHAVYWLGMLLASKLTLPKVIFVHGYLTNEGEKMSKSLGNVVNPYELIEKYGLEPLRYYLLRAIPSHNDGDFSINRFETLYTAELANGLGNLCSRIAKLAKNNSLFIANKSQAILPNEYISAMDNFQLDNALDMAVKAVTDLDLWLSQNQPWKKSVLEQKDLIFQALEKLAQILLMFAPFLPETIKQAQADLENLSKQDFSPLFPRLKTQ